MSITSFQDLRAALQDAISADGGLAVYRYYGFEPSRRAQSFNPFREERTSSFYITHKFGKVIFKDFGDDNMKGDCRKFVMLYENVDAKQAFKILCHIYNLHFIENFTPPKPPTLKVQNTSQKAKKDVEKTLLDIKFKPFSQEELAFWQQKGGISLAILQQNGVQSVASFKIKTGDKIQFYQNLQFIFAYTIVPKQAYKLYMPKENYRVYGKSKTIFLPNLAPAKQCFGEDFSYHFGIETLCETNKELIICAGEPDCLSLKSMGYNAFTLGDERTQIPDFIWQKLQEKVPNFRLKVLYDTDYTGLQHSQKLAQKYAIQRIILPKLAQQMQVFQPKPTHNDVCDYWQLYAHDTDLRLALSQNIISKQADVIANVPTFEVEKYLSEQAEILLQWIKQQDKILIEGDAGIGKTFTILSQIATKLDQNVLFVVPFAIQVEQIAQEYSERIPELVCFANQDDNLQKTIGKINVCTFDKAKSVFQPDMYVFVDECHLLTSEYGYRTHAIQEVMQVVERAKKKVFLSATPDYSFCQDQDFKLIRFKRKHHPQVNINTFLLPEEANRRLTMLQIIIQKITAYDLLHTEKTLIVRLNHKNLAQEMANLIVKKGLLSAENIDFVFSFKRKDKTTASRKAIIETGFIPSGVKLLFVTACFDCGINVLNTNIAEVLSLETRYTDNCPDTLIQVVQRFRNLPKIDVLVCKTAQQAQKPTLPSLANFRQNLYKDAQNRIQLLAYQQKSYLQKLGLKTLAFEKMPTYIKTNDDISANFKILALNEQKQFVPNTHYIRFAAKEFARKNMGVQEFLQALQEALPNLNHQIIDLKNTTKHLTEQWYQDLKDLQNETKKAKKEAVEGITQALAQEPNRVLDTVFHSYQDLHLKQKIAQQINPSPPAEAITIEQLLPDSQQNRQYDEQLVRLSKRYFTLKELLLPKERIPDILQKYDSDVVFGSLLKMLSNQINLFVAQELGYELPLVMRDARQIENTQFLGQLIEWVEQDLSQENFEQKRTQHYKAQLQSLQYDLKLYQYERRNLYAIYLNQTIQRKRRPLYRKMQTIAKKIRKTCLMMQKIQEKITKTSYKAVEINQLSAQINQLRPHKKDAKSLKMNIQLLQTLFEMQTKRKRIMPTNQPSASVQVQECILVYVGKKLTLCEILQKIGLTFAEAKAYIELLRYKIQEDKQKAWQTINAAEGVSKNIQLANETAISYITSTYHTLHNAFVTLNAYGYPACWD